MCCGDLSSEPVKVAPTAPVRYFFASFSRADTEPGLAPSPPLMRSRAASMDDPANVGVEESQMKIIVSEAFTNRSGSPMMPGLPGSLYKPSASPWKSNSPTLSSSDPISCAFFQPWCSRATFIVLPTNQPSLLSGPARSSCAERHLIAFPSNPMICMSTLTKPGWLELLNSSLFTDFPTSCANRHFLPQGVTNALAPRNGQLELSCTTTRRSVGNVSAGSPLENMRLRRAKTVRMEPLFSLEPPLSSKPCRSAAVIITTMELALCAATRTKSWFSVGSPFLNTTSRPILVRLGLMLRAAKASRTRISMSSFSCVLFMMTTGAAETGLDGCTRVHGNSLRAHVSFCIK
mmetsp:Transcript_13260/g.26112  ORF Transcript_13260/g.26112 Transcript_13260/m.26112 type:complete len:347 (+) Transcript_13260:1041-2081(+)